MNYTALNQIINNKLISEECIYDGNIISAYDLINCLNSELGEFNCLLKNKNLIKDFFNLPKSKMFYKTINNIGTGLESFDFGYQKIRFCFNHRNTNKFSELCIYKNNDNLSYVNYHHPLMLKEQFINEFILLNKVLISEILSLMERLKKNYNLNLDYGNNYQLFPLNNINSVDKLYWIYYTEDMISYSDCKIRMVSFDDDFLNINPSQKEELLKRIPILISDLPSIYQKVIKVYYQNNDNLKCKVLTNRK